MFSRNKLFLRKFTVFWIWILLRLQSTNIFKSSSSYHGVDADAVLSNCNICITLRVVAHAAGAMAAGTSAMEAKCNLETIADGTVGSVAIIRSDNLSSIAQTLVAGTGTSAYLGGDDAAVEGDWRWWKTGELFYIPGMGNTKFSYTDWNAGEPSNSLGAENWVEIKVGKWNDIPLGTSQTVCMFQPQRTAYIATPTTATSEMTQFGIIANRSLFEIQPFPIHYSFTDANAYCRNRTRTDPFTGANISGQLAILRSAAQSAALRDLIFGQTDIPFHTTTAGFGVWLGGMSTNATAKSVGYNVTLQSSIEDIMTNGVCDNLNYCNFSAAAISASWPSSSALAMQVKGSDPTWMIQDKSDTMPFACSYEYSLLATINATSLDATLQNSISNAEMTMFLSFGDHVDWLTAKSRCAGLSRTNSASETATGELAAIFSNKSNAAITALANAASYGDRSTNTSSFGLWVGASTDIENPSTASHSCNLRWNYSSSASLSKPLISSCSGLGNPTFCASSRTNGFYCNMDSTSTSSGWPQNESRGLVVAIKQNPSPWTTLPVSKPLPYVCSFRFIFRQNITEHLSGEIHTTPRPFDAAASFCGTRQIGKAGDTRTGVLLPWKKGGWGRIVTFATKHSANDNPVWIGDKDPSNSSRCLAVYPQNTSLAYFPCSTELPHICLFIISNASSITKSHSVSAKRTQTISETISSKLSSSISISADKTTSTSISSKLSSSISISEYETTSISLSDSISSSATFSKSTDPTSSTTFSSSTIVTKTFSDQTSSKSKSEFTHTISFLQNTSTASLLQTQSQTRKASPSPSLTVTKNVRRLDPVPSISGLTGITTSVGTVAAFAGIGAVAAQQNKMAAVASLVHCGDGEGISDDEPDLLSSPLQLRIGDDVFGWHRGLLIGNILVLVIVGVFVLVAAFVYSRTAGKCDFQTALLHLRFPGILILPILILMPPSAEKAVVLFLLSEGTRGKDFFLAIFCGTVLVFAPCVVTLMICHVSARGRLVMHEEHIEQGRWIQKKCPKFAESPVYKIFQYLTEIHFEFTDGKTENKDINNDNNNDSGILDPTLLLDDHNNSGNHHHMSKRGSEGAMEFLAKNPWVARVGPIVESFSLFYFAFVDISVSVVLGLTAGTAAGIGSYSHCIAIFSINIICCFIHLFLLLRYRGVTPRFVLIFLTSASVVTFLAVILALVQYLGRLLDFNGAWDYLGLIQAILGIFAAILGIIGFADFFYQLLKSYGVGGSSENDESKNPSQTVKGSKNFQVTQEFLVLHDDDFLIDIEEELRNLPSSEPVTIQQQQEPIDPTILLSGSEKLGNTNDPEIEEIELANLVSQAVQALLDTTQGNNNNDDDHHDIFSKLVDQATSENEGLSATRDASRGNEEMMRNQCELRRMFRGTSNRPGSAGGGVSSSGSGSGASNSNSNNASLSSTHIPVGLQFTVSSLLTDTVGLLLPSSQPSGVTLNAILRLPAHCAMRAHISSTEWLNAAPTAMGLSEEVAVRLFEAFSLLWQHQGQRYERRIESTRAVIQAMAGNTSNAANIANSANNNNNNNNRQLSYSAVTAQRAVSLPGFMIFLAAQTFLERAHLNGIQPGGINNGANNANNSRNPQNPQVSPPETYSDAFLAFVRENLSNLMSFLCMGTPGRICVADLQELRLLFREWDNGAESAFGTKLSFLWGASPNNSNAPPAAATTIESQVLIQLLRSRLCTLSELRGGGQGAAASLLLYRGVSHQTVQAGSSAIPRCSEMHNCVRLQRCNQSTFYLVGQALPSVVISRCTNCVVFLGPVAGALVVDRCEHCQIIALCAGVVVQGGGKNVTLFVGTNTPPILVPGSGSGSGAANSDLDGANSETSSNTSGAGGGSSASGVVYFAPYNTCYPALEDHCLQAKVNPKLNLFAEKNRNSAQWMSGGSSQGMGGAGTTTTATTAGFVTLLSPSQFSSLVVPPPPSFQQQQQQQSATSAVTRTNPVAMPAEYSQALQERVAKCTEVSNSLLGAYRTLEGNGRTDLADDLRKKVQSAFVEWLEASGQVQGLADLLTIGGGGGNSGTSISSSSVSSANVAIGVSNNNNNNQQNNNGGKRR